MRAVLIWTLVLVTMLAGVSSPVTGTDKDKGKKPAHERPVPGLDLLPDRDRHLDALLARILGDKEQDTYELTANFKASLTLIVRGSPFTAEAEGTYTEVRKAGEPRRRKVSVERLDLPLLLRPFSATLQRVIEKKLNLQPDRPETFHSHDFFLLEVQDEERNVLGGVYRGIVDEALDLYGQPSDDRNDRVIRRSVARWLYSSPSMRTWIMRPGPPYAVRAVVDDDGLVYDLVLFYNWGQVGTKISYVFINGQPLWQQIITDTVSDLSGVGHMNGQLTLTFSNHCLNCRQ